VSPTLSVDGEADACLDGLKAVGKYPGCCVEYPDWIGDGECDWGTYNTKECGYDGGDCEPPYFNNSYPACSYGLYQVEGYPGCCVEQPDLIGNDECDVGTYMTEECGFDGGDCTCLAADPEQCGCGGSIKQQDYRGTISVTESECACEQWNADLITELNGYDYVQEFPDSGLENNNYCRNPGGDNRAWCFITFPNCPNCLEACNVPYCMAGPERCFESVLDDDDVSDELKWTCNYHQCTSRYATQPIIEVLFAPTRDEVEPTCRCAFELWDCAYGSLDCKNSFASGNLHDCCEESLDKSDMSSSSLHASCECFIKPGCEEE
jgi:hypothetical protein